MGIDSKYGKITTERGSIPESEPVLLFRSKDALLPQVITAYRALCVTAGSPPEHLERIDATLDTVLTWQAANPTQTPGSGVIADVA